LALPHFLVLTGAFSDFKLGLRLRYEIRRKFARYIDINSEQKYGATANFFRRKNENISNTELVIGLHAWF
jgi:copper resistance protein B